jgi:hypothetical protein
MYHQVMPIIVDYLSIFGPGLKSKNYLDENFSSFREQMLFGRYGSAMMDNHIGRSGQQFQITYVLRSMANSSPQGTSRENQFWNARPAVIHHQFDTVNGNTLWLVAQGGEELEKRIQELTGSSGRIEDKSFGNATESFRSSLSVHLLNCFWASEGWRWRIQSLTQLLEQKVNKHDELQIKYANE